MIKDFRQGEYIEETFYEVRFFSTPSGGLAFPCDKDGKMIVTENTNPAAIKNYRWALENPDKFKWCFNRVVEMKSRWREPNTGICNCGNRIELVNDYLGACECPHCKQWWSLSGQMLNPVGTWADGDDWDYEY